MNPGGFLVCKFALKRMPGQPPLPTRPLVSAGDDTDAADEGDEIENEDEPEPEANEAEVSSDALAADP